MRSRSEHRRGVREEGQGMEKSEKEGGERSEEEEVTGRVPPCHSPLCWGPPHTPVGTQDIWHACQWDGGNGRGPTVHCCPALKLEDGRDIRTHLPTHSMLLNWRNLKVSFQTQWRAGMEPRNKA